MAILCFVNSNWSSSHDARSPILLWHVTFICLSLGEVLFKHAPDKVCCHHFLVDFGNHESIERLVAIGKLYGSNPVTVCVRTCIIAIYRYCHLLEHLWHILVSVRERKRLNLPDLLQTSHIFPFLFLWKCERTSKCARIYNENFFSAYMDSSNVTIDSLIKEVRDLKTSLEFTQSQVEGLRQLHCDEKLDEIQNNLTFLWKPTTHVAHN
mgnify:CR=1 FL=1